MSNFCTDAAQRLEVDAQVRSNQREWHAADDLRVVREEKSVAVGSFSFVKVKGALLAEYVVVLY